MGVIIVKNDFLNHSITSRPWRDVTHLFDIGRQYPRQPEAVRDVFACVGRGSGAFQYPQDQQQDHCADGGVDN